MYIVKCFFIYIGRILGVVKGLRLCAVLMAYSLCYRLDFEDSHLLLSVIHKGPTHPLHPVTDKEIIRYEFNHLKVLLCLVYSSFKTLVTQRKYISICLSS